jgi:hypothetical protein
VRPLQLAVPSVITSATSTNAAPYLITRRILFHVFATSSTIKNPDETVDTQIWISKSRGLPLKQIYDIDVNGGARCKSHTEIRYEYTNVTAPPIEPRRR